MPEWLLTLLNVPSSFPAGTNDGAYRGTHNGSKNEALSGGFEGRPLNHGAALRGFWWDRGAGITEANRFECTLDIMIDVAADPSGNTMVGKFRGKDGATGEWTAKRVTETFNIQRQDGKIASFVFRDKKVFDNLTDNLADKKKEFETTGRETAFKSSVMRRNFDGAMAYIPSIAVSDPYATEIEVIRRLNREEEEERKLHMAAMEEELAALKEGKVKGDEEALKKRLERLKKAIKGEKGWETLRNRTGKESFHPPNAFASMRPVKIAPYKGSPYQTMLEVQREMNAGEQEKWKAQVAKLEETVGAAQAKYAKAKAEGAGVDEAKAEYEKLKKRLKAEKTWLELSARRGKESFKPSSLDASAATSKPLPYKGSKYMSQLELQRALSAEEEVKRKATLAKKEVRTGTAPS